MRAWRHPAWHVPPSQVALRSTVLLGAAAGVLGAAQVGPVPGWALVAVAVLAVLSVAQPDSMAGWGLVAAIGVAWLVQPAGGVSSPWLLLAAAGVVAVHVGLLVAAQGPAVMRPDPAQLRVWARRGAGLWAVAALLWLAARWLRGTPGPSGLLVAVLVLLLAAIVWAGSRLTAEGPPDRP